MKRIRVYLLFLFLALLSGCLLFSGKNNNPFSLSQGIYPVTGDPEIRIVAAYTSPDTIPGDMTFDGTYIYLVGCDQNKIFKIDPSNGNTVATITPASLTLYQSGSNNTSLISYTASCGLVWIDGFLWCTASTDNTKIYKLDSSGNQISTITKENYCCAGLAWDGTCFWATDNTNKYLKKLDSSGNKLTSFPFFPDFPAGCVMEGEHLWVNRLPKYTSSDTSLCKVTPGNGTTVSKYEFNNDFITGLTHDGEYFWIASASKRKIYKVLLTD